VFALVSLFQNQMSRIYLSPPHMGGTEMQHVQKAFADNWIAPVGPAIGMFEQQLCQFTEAKHAVALNSGTAAIHLALILLGVGPGDEVICPSLTFSASANPIVYLGAQPVFVDSEAQSWNMCPEMLEAAIADRIAKGKKPKAIVVVHLYGQAAQMDRIMDITLKYEIPVIEDAAEAFGSEYKGKKLGTIGDIGIYSFNGNKIITTSGGGALVNNNPEFTERALYLATQAREDMPYYHHTEVGYNYRISNISAAIGCGQMEVLRERIQQKLSVFSYYKEAFADISAISMSPELERSFSTRWLSCLLIKEKRSAVKPANIIAALTAENIEARHIWKPMHTQPVFAKAPYYSQHHTSDHIFEQGLCLPSGTALTERELEKIAGIVKSCF
jgi:dTDP-4-amino-4,6-dideoxygalactose transaminase